MTEIQLRHYTDSPDFILDRDHVYGYHMTFKPSGLWVSVPGDYDWPAWCRAEEFRLDRLAHEYEVTLSPDARILHLDDLFDIEGLTDRYPNPGKWDEYPDWDAVARDYDGLIIAPYSWSARWDVSWYYGWDCASGCIWNLNAIESVTSLAMEVTT